MPFRSFAPGLALVAVALIVGSCSTEPGLPTSPTLSSPLAQGAPVEYFVTLADETPPPEPAPGERAPAPGEPEPAPGEPAPAPPPAPSPAPADSWPPGPPPLAAPGVPVPTPPSTHFRLRLKVDPEPVPYSGRPIADVRSCQILRHTWFYDQFLHAETGIALTINERENFFDGRFVGKNTERFRIEGNGTVVLKTRWCSGYGKFHYAQTRFKGQDENGEAFTISGPWVRLLAP